MTPAEPGSCWREWWGGWFGEERGCWLSWAGMGSCPPWDEEAPLAEDPPVESFPMSVAERWVVGCSWKCPLPLLPCCEGWWEACDEGVCLC
jgi:hypothetical protein